ncbi:hypothetical protein [cf. Phormidesmis sp. LEGE 11477]|uniref:hypothetical protein n=1 Tax=cf. Phormidesmis sp. LEGE 11477 TaxID=1828680 RepID=UPI00187DF8C5|nr:hypothetical protein [cf. Phormidesmis sp. LEGE 11477]MBE9064692.1 hypothetical protein [cf. Phormidesmis sp. LEGE 11477]
MSAAVAGRDWMVREWRDRRVIAGLRFVDATTGGSILQPLRLAAARSEFVQNRRGFYVLLSAPGFENYTNTFDITNAVAPAATVLNINIQDPTGQYLPRQFSLSLPRDADSDLDSVGDESLFRPVRVTLYPSAIAPTNPNWAILRTTVLNNANQRLPWALIKTTVNTETTLTQADWRGEALIAIPGIPIVTASSDESSEDPSTREFSADLEVVFDPALNTIAEDANFLELVDPNPGYMPNPEQLNADRRTLQTGSETLMLASGRHRSLRLAVTLS